MSTDWVEGRPLEEEQLVERAREGDLDAFGELVRRHQAMALRVAALVVGDPTEAEDVTQDAFVKAHRNLHRFTSGRPFRPWLLTIVRNESRNRRRRRGRQAQLTLRAARDPVSEGATPSSESGVIAEETRRRLLDAVNGLPEHYRLVVGCRYLLELSEAETAAVLGVSTGTVKSRTARGLERLRAVVTELEVAHE
ncbi:MAG: RNA polymerase sigma factor [Acidimicrobiia bacterium]